MKKRIILAAIVAVLIVLIGAGLFVLRGRTSITTVMYYLDKTETALVADNESVHYDDPSQIPHNIIMNLKKGKLGAISPVPEECTVNSISFDSPDKITVDLSWEFLSDNPQLNILRTYAIVKSVCSTAQFIGITNVRVTVEGNPIKATDGTALSYLSNQAINVMNSLEVITYECELFFLDYTSDTLKSERRKIDAANGTVEHNAVAALIDGPNSKGLRRIFPRGTKLISAQTYDSVCYVNFAVLPADTDVNIVSAALKYTLSAFNDIKDVKILINGKDPNFA